MAEKKTPLNNGQLYALAALYAKKFVSHEISKSFEEYALENIEAPYYCNPSQVGTAVAIGQVIVNQFGSDYQAEEFQMINAYSYER
jgi:hypothetical protein